MLTAIATLKEENNVSTSSKESDPIIETAESNDVKRQKNKAKTDEKAKAEGTSKETATKRTRKTKTSKNPSENNENVAKSSGANENSKGEKSFFDQSTGEAQKTNEKEFQSVGEITQTMVANQLYHVYLRCMQEIPVTAKDKETGKQVPTGIYQFDVRSALKALELLGDAVGLFKPVQQEETKTQSYEEFLKSGGYDYEF